MCSHFIWYDEEMTLREKEMIFSLDQRLSLKKNNVNECKLKEDKLNMKIKFLNMQLKFTYVISFVLLICLVAESVMK